jgi:lipopolysaccharide export system protein LptA
MMRFAAGVLALAALLTPPALSAQEVPPGVPALPPDTIPADTLAADTAAVADRPPLSSAADSVFQILRQLQGFTRTEYTAETAVYHADRGVLRLEGSADVTRDGDRLTADTIIYYERADLMEAIGSPRVVGEGQDLEAEVLYYDLATRRATARQARTQIVQDATWFVTGDVTVEGTNRLFGRNAHFTSCDLAIPHYHIRSDQIVAIRDQILVARPATLYIGNVPLMWLPFVVQNLERGRRSGFLTPRFGVHDVVRANSGYHRQLSDVGFYWSVNEYVGATVSTTWRSGAYTALLGNLDYNWRRQFLRGNFGTERYWRDDGRREISFNTQTSWQPDERTNLGINGRYASSADFVRDASFDPREVTQDLNSSLSLGRRFDWGQASFGADRRQSIATGDVSMTLPSFSISPRPLTLFRSPGLDDGRWFNNATFTPGVITGARSSVRYADNIRVLRQDQDLTRLRVGPSLSVGNFTFSSGADLNRAEIREAAGLARTGEVVTLRGYDREDASWQASASYRQPLVGSTSIAPAISLNQQLVRDTLTAGQFVQAPVRMTFGAGLNTDLYGFFPGVGPFTGIRHRLSPRVSYGYAPQVQQTALQEQVFGRAGGRTQNRVSFGVNQTFEAKLRTPTPAEESTVPQDTLAGDTIPQSRVPSTPGEPEKVTLLSLTTSSFDYDFTKAREEGSGFVTDHVSNTISSDYLRGLTIQMTHDLFDRSTVDPSLPGNVGNMGRFAPRLSSLSTAFELGPQSTLFQWLDRVVLGRGDEPYRREGVLPGDPASDDPSPAGLGTFAGNPQGTGGGPWRVSLSYQLSRPPRIFNDGRIFSDDTIQTLDANSSFQLTPNWSVTWATSYSVTDGQFGAHRMNFARSLHEWQANFSFYQTPNGNSAFMFYVELLHNRDLRFEHSERNLGIDRPR